jgi:hypothetical protein
MIDSAEGFQDMLGMIRGAHNDAGTRAVLSRPLPSVLAEDQSAKPMVVTAVAAAAGNDLTRGNDGGRRTV